MFDKRKKLRKKTLKNPEATNNKVAEELKDFDRDKAVGSKDLTLCS